MPGVKGALRSLKLSVFNVVGNMRRVSFNRQRLMHLYLKDYSLLFLIFAVSASLELAYLANSNFLPLGDDASWLIGNAVWTRVTGASILTNSIWVNEPYYPAYEVMLAGISMASGVPEHQTYVVLNLIVGSSVPVLVFLILRDAYDSRTLAFIGAIFAAISLPATFYLTGGKLFGSVGLITVWLIIWLLQKFEITRNSRWLILLGSVALLSPLFHQLSAFVTYASLLIYIIINFRRDKRLLLLALVFPPGYFIAQSLISAGTNLGTLNLAESFLAVLYYGNTTQLTNFVYPLDYPTQLGYAIIAIGVLGALLGFRKRIPGYKFLIILPLVSLAMTNSVLLGFTNNPVRYMYYVDISLIAFSPLALEFIREKVTLHFKNITGFVFAIVLLAASFHTITVVNSTYAYGGKNTVPTTEDIDAIQWLKRNTLPDSAVVTARYPPYFAALYWIPILSERHTAASYVPVSADIPSTPDYSALEPVGALGQILQPYLSDKLINAKKERLDELHYRGYVPFYILKYPDEDRTRELLEQYNIKYVYTYVGTPEDVNIQQSNTFELVYSNLKVRIYEARI